MADLVQRLLYPLDFFPQADAEQEAMSEAFITVLENFLGVKRTPISIINTWESNPPPRKPEGDHCWSI